MAPTARLMKIWVGTISIPTKASTTVSPENITARPAVPADRSIAASTSQPAGALLAEPRDDEQAVVDADRKPHEREHVDGEEAQR